MEILSKFYGILTTSDMFNMNSRPFMKEVNLDTALAQLRNRI